MASNPLAKASNLHLSVSAGVPVTLISQEPVQFSIGTMLCLQPVNGKRKKLSKYDAPDKSRVHQVNCKYDLVLYKVLLQSTQIQAANTKTIVVLIGRFVTCEQSRNPSLQFVASTSAGSPAEKKHPLACLTSAMVLVSMKCFEVASLRRLT